MQAVQQEIAQALKVQPPFADAAALEAEVARRVAFIKDCLANARLKTLVLGISGGVDSLTAALLAQRAINELRAETGDQAYTFIAVRLPYQVQHDEHDAQACLDVIRADEVHTVDIAPAVRALAAEVVELKSGSPALVDFVVGNVKARTRMVAQYTIAGARAGLVIGTDHAAEAVMGFFTKFGDGACDLAPLSGAGVTGGEGADCRPGRPGTGQTGRSLAWGHLPADRRVPAWAAGRPGSVRHHRGHLPQDPAQARIAVRPLIRL